MIAATWMLGMAVNCALCLWSEAQMRKLAQYGFMFDAMQPRGLHGLRMAGFVLGSWVTLIGWLILK